MPWNKSLDAVKDEIRNRQEGQRRRRERERKAKENEAAAEKEENKPCITKATDEYSINRRSL